MSACNPNLQERAPAINALWQDISTGYSALNKRGFDAVLAASALGKTLIAIKNSLPYGQFEKEVQLRQSVAELNIPRLRMCRYYMRLEHARAIWEPHKPTTIKDAMKIAEQKKTESVQQHRKPANRAEIEREIYERVRIEFQDEVDAYAESVNKIVDAYKQRISDLESENERLNKLLTGNCFISFLQRFIQLHHPDKAQIDTEKSRALFNDAIVLRKQFKTERPTMHVVK